MSAREIRAGKAFVEIGAKDKLSSALLRMQGRLRTFAAGVRKIGLGLAAASAAIETPLTFGVLRFAKFGDELAKMSQRTGISVETLSALRYAVEQSGASIEELEVGVRNMQRQLTAAAGGAREAQVAFGELGFTTAQLLAMSPAEQFLRLATAVSAIKDPTLRAGAALKVFGKSGTALLPLLADGPEGVWQLMEAAERLGQVMSTDAANAAVELGDRLDDVKKTVDAAFRALGEALAPVLIDIAKWVAKAAVKLKEFIDKNRKLVVIGAAAALAIGVLGVALLGLSVVINTLSTVLGVLPTILSAVMSPIGLITAGVAAAGVAFTVWAVTSTEAGDTVRATFAETWGGIKDALASGDLALAAKIAWAGFKLAFLEFARPFRETWRIFVTDLMKAFFFFVDGIAEGLVRIGELVGLTDEGHAGRIEEINRQRFKALDAAQQAEIDALRKQIDDSRRELESLAQQARDANQPSSPGAAGRKLAHGRGPEDYLDEGAAAAAAVRRKGTSVGTFSAAAFRLGGGRNLDMKILDANREQVRVLNRIERKIGPPIPFKWRN